MTNQPIAEIVTFRLKYGTDPASFRAAAQGLEPFLQRTGGMMRRTLSCDTDGLWTDHILWRSMADAETAQTAVMQAPEAGPMMMAIDEASVSMRHAAVELEQA